MKKALTKPQGPCVEIATIFFERKSSPLILGFYFVIVYIKRLSVRLLYILLSDIFVLVHQEEYCYLVDIQGK